MYMCWWEFKSTGIFFCWNVFIFIFYFLLTVNLPKGTILFLFIDKDRSFGVLQIPISRLSSSTSRVKSSSFKMTFVVREGLMFLLVLWVTLGRILNFPFFFPFLLNLRKASLPLHIPSSPIEVVLSWDGHLESHFL